MLSDRARCAPLLARATTNRDARGARGGPGCDDGKPRLHVARRRARHEPSRSAVRARLRDRRRAWPGPARGRGGDRRTFGDGSKGDRAGQLERGLAARPGHRGPRRWSSPVSSRGSASAYRDRGTTQPTRRFSCRWAASAKRRRASSFVGLNRRRPLDGRYREFLDLVASQVSAAITRVGAHHPLRRRRGRGIQLAQSPANRGVRKSPSRQPRSRARALATSGANRGHGVRRWVYW